MYPKVYMAPSFGDEYLRQAMEKGSTWPESIKKIQKI